MILTVLHSINKLYPSMDNSIVSFYTSHRYQIPLLKPASDGGYIYIYTEYFRSKFLPSIIHPIPLIHHIHCGGRGDECNTTARPRDILIPSPKKKKTIDSLDFRYGKF